MQSVTSISQKSTYYTVPVGVTSRNSGALLQLLEKELGHLVLTLDEAGVRVYVEGLSRAATRAAVLEVLTTLTHAGYIHLESLATGEAA